MTSGPFDIVGEDEGEFFSVRPTRPTGRHGSGLWINWPAVAIVLELPGRQPTAQRKSQTLGHQRLDSIVETAKEHLCEWTSWAEPGELAGKTLVRRIRAVSLPAMDWRRAARTSRFKERQTAVLARRPK